MIAATIHYMLFLFFYNLPSTANSLAGRQYQQIRTLHLSSLSLGAYEYLLKKSSGQDVDVSRLFIYYNGRARKKNVTTITDSGCSMTNAIEALEEFGTCLESVWPYDIASVNTKPHEQAYEQGKDHQITGAMKVNIDLNEMKSCLAQGFPFAFGIRLYQSFNKAAKTGVVPLPDADERERSEHGRYVLIGCQPLCRDSCVFLFAPDTPCSPSAIVNNLALSSSEIHGVKTG
jgi:hypothetical protein